MKGFIISGLAGLFIASLGATSYADPIRVNATNESGVRTNLIIGAQKRVVSLADSNATLFTADYNYPDRISVQTLNTLPKPCDWARSRPPGIRMAAMQSVDIIISMDPMSHSPSCLIDWH